MEMIAVVFKVFSARPRAAESVKKMLKAFSKVISCALERAAGILILAMEVTSCVI